MAIANDDGSDGHPVKPPQPSALTSELSTFHPETDRDGDTIMQDSQPLDIFSKLHHDLRQFYTGGSSFLVGRAEHTSPGSARTNVDARALLPHPLQTEPSKHDTVQNLRDPTAFNRSRLPVSITRTGVDSSLQEPEQDTGLSQLPPHPTKSQDTDGLLNESSVIMTLLPDSEVVPPLKRHRPSPSYELNQTLTERLIRSRTLSSPTPSPIRAEESFWTARPPSLESAASQMAAVSNLTSNPDINEEFHRVDNGPLGSPRNPSVALPYQDVAANIRQIESNANNDDDTIVQSVSTASMNPFPTPWGLSRRLIAIPVSRKRKAFDVKQIPCTGCLDEFDATTLIKLPCQCRYCSECLNRLVIAGCTTAADFPPKCHGQPLRISTYGPALNKEASDRYKQVEAEFSTSTPKYCAVPTCSAFIAKSQIIESEDIGVCSKCGKCTCTRCDMLLTSHTYEKQEFERVCPQEGSDMVALRALGLKEDWTQCPACQTMIDKIDGCNHVACNCGVEFCYSCGSFYNEENLCECQSDGFEDDGDDIDSLDAEDHENDDDEDVWPDHRRIFDSMGRQKCWHLTTQIVPNEICHGCLKETTNTQHRSCRECHSEFCQECLDNVYEDHIKALDREHEDAVWKILSTEQEQLDLPLGDIATAHNTKTASMSAHEASMVVKWEPHQGRLKETWLQHKEKVGLS